MAKEIVLNGRNIYYDKHNRAIYYNKRTKTGYIIPNELTSRYQALSYRYTIGLIAFVFCQSLFNFNIWMSLLVAVGGYGYMEWNYRKFLSRTTQIKSFNPSNARPSVSEAKNIDTGGLILRVCLYIALSILLIINVFLGKYLETNILIAIASFVISALSGYMAVRYILALVKK
ncbi:MULTISPECIES: hypothetical protein [unclassified Breznakia]|uniref:hypothetical protein n=1 Tax=unclassified Breznakia TaxID=2623764 RepID=UPI002474554E|nr:MULTISPECIES: hypothetical protein [unclassified Breznakia]MDH6366500.1 nitrate reductase NapE component [Breznakia sp. PH1-1]MDH6403593.1 nitrate reductase NapE component [Breznakia sp. PF1-11]MDH6411302.1 nitrate reductase NapE component [Breznakia sp. PFB1-11]MDH6413722.1 nitrate reductase NapE component [Breznakia sp. PFB1-14]MDH6415847.1 nitrate reductase NapE component [Breznakia sp. PFB1-4]